VVPLLKYSLLRLVLFGGILAILLLLHTAPLIAVIGAALISMMLSYLFLAGPRNEVTTMIADRVERRNAERAPTATEQDEAIEDAAADAERQSAE
jgi:Protein of unknown function (DUF4229)